MEDNTQKTTDTDTTLTLTENEKNVLLQLIDLAVKSGGINVAEAAIYLAKKLNSPQ
jgi:hypothetical protein